MGSSPESLDGWKFWSTSFAWRCSCHYDVAVWRLLTICIGQDATCFQIETCCKSESITRDTSLQHDVRGRSLGVQSSSKLSGGGHVLAWHEHCSHVRRLDWMVLGISWNYTI